MQIYPKSSTKHPQIFVAKTSCSFHGKMVIYLTKSSVSLSDLIIGTLEIGAPRACR